MEHLEHAFEGVYAHTTRSILVTVEPQFLRDQSDPTQHRFVWAYHVHIENQGSESVQLISRYWHITDELGRVQEVTGEGVIGEQPVIVGGESYTYTSGTPLATPSGIMRGHYVMQTPSGETFKAEIPAFSLDTPDLLRSLH